MLYSQSCDWFSYCDVRTVVVKAFISGGFCPFWKVLLLLLHVIVLYFYCCWSSLRGALAPTALICAGKYDVRGLRAALCCDAAGCSSAATRRRKSQLLCTCLMCPYLHPVYNYQWIIFRNLCNCNTCGSLYSATRGIYEACFVFFCVSAMFCRDNKDGRGYKISGDGRMNSLSSICYSPIRPSLLRLAAPEIWYRWRVRKQNWDITGGIYSVLCNWGPSTVNGVLKMCKCSLHVDNKVTEKHKRGQEVLENEIVPGRIATQ